MSAAELRGNWEDKPRPGADGSRSLWWPKTPEERTCPMCRRDLKHTETEHELLYPPAYTARRERERAEEQAQVARDSAYLHKLVEGGMTEDQAVDRWLAAITAGEDI
jgi:hypothetical protein